MTFAEKLRQLRDAAGLTQEQMAKRSGINLWTIRGYEQGRREPNWKGVLSLAKALNVAAEVFSECDETTVDEQSARPWGRPRKPEAPTDLPVAPSEREEMPTAQSKSRHRKTRKPTGG
jgi:transcriptional regulator with XRE-family HTH domain